MTRDQTIEDTLKTSFFAIIVFFVIAYIPYKVITAENHTVIAAIGRFRDVGYILIGLGIIGIWSVFETSSLTPKGHPYPGIPNTVLVRGLSIRGRPSQPIDMM